jgi:hypothetical protein
VSGCYAPGVLRATVGLVACLLVACGGRSALDPGEQDASAPHDAGRDVVDASVPRVDAGHDAGRDSGTPRDAAADTGFPAFDAGLDAPFVATGPVLFGGAPDSYASDAVADTWAWTGTAWLELSPGGPGAPPPRIAAAMAFLDGTLVLFGGGNGTFGESLLDDTWTWDGATWRDLPVTGPSSRRGAVMAPLGGKLVLFGGSTNGSDTPFGDTWTFDGTAWTQLDVPGPAPRTQAAMAPLGGKLVLFGGYVDPKPEYADTWTWDGAAWTQLAVTGPPGQGGGVLAPLGDRLVLLSANVYAATDDTWTFDGAAWTHESVVSPTARGGYAMSAVDGGVLVFGGLCVAPPCYGGLLGDTWTWDGGASWTRVSDAGPSKRLQSQMATP